LSRAGSVPDADLTHYGDEDFELFWLYEPATDSQSFGHLHGTAETAQTYPVPPKPLPPDVPE
jgi:hypothetical protein